MWWHRYRLSRRSVFGILMSASALALLLPPRWTDGLKHVVQLLVFSQDAVHRTTRAALAPLAGIVEGDEAREADRERTALRNALGAMQGEIDQLRRQNRELAGLRDNYIPRPLPLLRANVVARDIAAWRDVVLVSRGSSRGVAKADWVASRFYVDHGTLSGLDPGQAVLARETLIGRVEFVSPYMSRVQLLTDIDARPIEVRIGAPDKTGPGAPRFVTVDYVCSLRGRGAGEMVISNVPNKYVDSDGEEGNAAGKRRIRIGDQVVTAPGQFGIPTPMAVGEVVRFEEDPEERLVWDVVVRPLVTPEQLAEVYVISAIASGLVPIN